MFCTKCGTNFSETDCFCSNCGTPTVKPHNNEGFGTAPQTATVPSQPIGQENLHESKSRFFFEKDLEQATAWLKKLNQWFAFIGGAAIIVAILMGVNGSWAGGLFVGGGTWVILLICYFMHYKPALLRKQNARDELNKAIQRGA